MSVRGAKGAYTPTQGGRQMLYFALALGGISGLLIHLGITELGHAMAQLASFFMVLLIGLWGFSFMIERLPRK